MAREKGKIQLIIERLRFDEFKVLWVLFAIGTIFYIGVIMDQIETGVKIDPKRDVYLFLHGRADLRVEAETILVTLGFPKENIIAASSENVGGVGDYMANALEAA